MLIAERGPVATGDGGPEVLLVRQFILASGGIWQLQLRLNYSETVDALK